MSIDLVFHNEQSLFEGTPEEIAEWLVYTAGDWVMQKDVYLVVGNTGATMSPDDYLRAFDQGELL